MYEPVEIKTFFLPLLYFEENMFYLKCYEPSGAEYFNTVNFIILSINWTNPDLKHTDFILMLPA